MNNLKRLEPLFSHPIYQKFHALYKKANTSDAFTASSLSKLISGTLGDHYEALTFIYAGSGKDILEEMFSLKSMKSLYKKTADAIEARLLASKVKPDKVFQRRDALLANIAKLGFKTSDEDEDEDEEDKVSLEQGPAFFIENLFEKGESSSKEDPMFEEDQQSFVEFPAYFEYMSTWSQAPEELFLICATAKYVAAYAHTKRIFKECNGNKLAISKKSREPKEYSKFFAVQSEAIKQVLKELGPVCPRR